jgi:hypothetical protein
MWAGGSNSRTSDDTGTPKVRQVKRAPGARSTPPPAIATRALFGYHCGQDAARTSQAQTVAGGASIVISLRTWTAARSGA